MLKRTVEQEAHGTTPLSPAAATQYRGLTARANYIAQDRAEIQFAVKELCRCMSTPNNDSWDKLKRLARYLAGRPRAVSIFAWQEKTDVLDIYSDANWAGCKASRKSTSGGTALWGGVCLKSYSKTQGTIAQSSAESELIAVVKAACEAIGSVALADDLGIKLRVRLHIDAAAALGILERQGVGRVRHLDIGVLWLQEQQLRRIVELAKVLGTKNPADLMTKHLAQEAVSQYAAVLGYDFRSGRSETTAKLHKLVRRSGPHGAEGVLLQGEQRMRQSIEVEGRPEAAQWECVDSVHWTCASKGARAFRSPAHAGVDWGEVERRVTVEVPSLLVIDDIRPRRDGISEASACTSFGGSRDIRTDIYLAPGGANTVKYEAGDAWHNDEVDGEDGAHPTANRRRHISDHRSREIARANNLLAQSPPRCPSSLRASAIRFSGNVIAIWANGEYTCGRLHVANVSLRNSLSSLSRCRRVRHSSGSVLGLRDPALFLCSTGGIKRALTEQLEGETKNEVIHRYDTSPGYGMGRQPESARARGPEPRRRRGPHMSPSTLWLKRSIRAVFLAPVGCIIQT